METLKTIQLLSKIGKVLSRIIFICCIIGFCGCIVGVICLGLGTETFKLGGVTVHSMIENKAGMNLPSLYAAMAVGIVFCAAEAVLCKFAETYFKNELADGTPFTLRGAKELMRLGILTIALSVSAAILGSVAVAVAEHYAPGVEKMSLGEFSSVGMGIAMIVVSLLCRHGAELTGGASDPEKEALGDNR